MTLYSLDDIKVAMPASGRYWVAPNAIVIGRVEIEEDASIWFNCVVRGDLDLIRIGPGSNVQEGSVLHTDPGFTLSLGRNCSVGHMAMLHGCTVGDGSLIGIGAIVLNGARIGSQSLVGAGALVTEGKEFPPRSLIVGSPARVIRQLGEEDVARIERTAANYQARWKRYVAGLEEQTP